MVNLVLLLNKLVYLKEEEVYEAVKKAVNHWRIFRKFKTRNDEAKKCVANKTFEENLRVNQKSL